MQNHIGIKITASLLSALLTAVSMGLDVAGVAGPVVGSFNWQWFTLGGFVVFLGSVTWIMAGQHQQMRVRCLSRVGHLDNGRPAPTDPAPAE